MNNTEENASAISSKAAWQALLADRQKLLKHPATDQKALIIGAHTLHRAQLIDSYDQSDFLEQADGALGGRGSLWSILYEFYPAEDVRCSLCQAIHIPHPYFSTDLG